MSSSGGSVQHWEALPPRKRNRNRARGGGGGGGGGGGQPIDDGVDEAVGATSSSAAGADRAGAVEGSESSINDSTKDSKGDGKGSGGNKDSKSSSYQTIESRTNTINDNIANRKKVVRVAATLEHKDGCAGEFFECKLYLFI